MEPRPPSQRSRLPASKIHLPHGDWSSVLDALAACFPAISREHWQERMRRGAVLDVALLPIEPERRYAPGMCVRYFRELPVETPIPFTESVLHVDEHLIVVDKPHFLPVMPAGAYLRETLHARMIERFDDPELVVLHRLDRVTAGLVMLSRNPETRAHYQALFRQRQIVKCYEALAPALPERVFPFVHRSRIAAGPEFFRTQEAPGTPNSETAIDVIARDLTHWHYRLTPVTGRKHQLRVHMAGLGAPILGDRLYPTLQDEAPDDYTEPLQLLARSLEFTDPVTGEPRRFESQLALSRT